MSRSVISIEGVSKMYRLGEVGTGTLTHDLQRAWSKFRGKPDPFAKLGVLNDRNESGGEYAWSLKDVTLEVKEGDILGVIGSNGAGKSTLLKILSRVTAPTTGRIRTKGRVASLLEVGTGFHPELTGRENVFLNGAILGMSKKEIAGRMDEIVEFSGCEKYIDTPVKRYSTGMQVRLGFAVAAHLECEILIVDEVLAVGDIDFQNKCLRWMQGAADSQQKTILFVSHDLDSIHRICNKGVCMNNGVITYQGDIKSTIKHYIGSGSIGDTDLVEVKDRWGDGQIKVTGFEILNSENVTQASLIPGQDYIFELSYSVINLEVLPVVGFVGSIDFIDDRGSRVLLLNSTSIDTSLSLLKNEGILRCYIKDFNLAPGNYAITLYLGETNKNTFDCLNSVMSVPVSGGDFFGTGHPGFPEQCKILKRTTWEII